MKASSLAEVREAVARGRLLCRWRGGGEYEKNEQGLCYSSFRPNASGQLEGLEEQQGSPSAPSGGAGMGGRTGMKGGRGRQA